MGTVHFEATAVFLCEARLREKDRREEGLELHCWLFRGLIEVMMMVVVMVIAERGRKL